MLTHCDSRRSHVRHVLDNPTAVFKLLVDVLAGEFFWCGQVWLGIEC